VDLFSIQDNKDHGSLMGKNWEIVKDIEAWRAEVHRVAKSWA